MTIKLSEDDIEQIEGWYQAASGESMVRGYNSGDGPAERKELAVLLDKLGIKPNPGDVDPFVYGEETAIGTVNLPPE